MAVRVSATTAPGQTFAGRVISVGEVDAQSGLLAVRVTVNNPGAVLRVGAFATADIVLGTNPTAVVVPKQAVVTSGEKNVVFVVTKDNTAHERDVKLGVEQGSDVEIARGVTAGERVITLGQYELTDGAEVKAARASER